MRTRRRRVELVGRRRARIDVVGRALVRHLGADRAAHGLKLEMAGGGDLGLIAEIKRDHQDAERRGAQYAADDKEVAAVAGALAGGRLLPLLLAQRLQLSLRSGHASLNSLNPGEAPCLARGDNHRSLVRAPRDLRVAAV